MWGEPREGTDAYKVKKFAEARKNEAQKKGFDRLLVDVYFEKLKGLAKRVAIGNGWDKYKHPQIQSLNEADGKLSFEFNSNEYAFEISNRNYMPYGDGVYYNLDLYLNGKKAFGLMVNEHSGEYVTTYSPSIIHAYANDDWVADVLEIQRHYDSASKASEIAYAEDPKKTNKMMQDFGMTESDLAVPHIATATQSSPHASTETFNPAVPKKPLWKRWWFWLIIGYFVLMFLQG